MSLKEIAEDFESCAYEMELSPDEMIESVANRLVDTVFEWLLDYGYGPSSYGCEKPVDFGLYPIIQRMVARAMFVQWQCDQDNMFKVLDSECGNKEERLPGALS